jgi:hypothetical protein
MAEPRKSMRYESEGTVYRVVDATYGVTPFKWRRYPLSDPKAMKRVFVAPDPAAMLRVYTFTAGEDRAPTPDALARQLRSATWSPREKVETPEHHGFGGF